MTILDILAQALQGKKVVGGAGPKEMIGSTIVSIRLHGCESLFVAEVRHPDSTLESFFILEDWDIVVE